MSWYSTMAPALMGIWRYYAIFAIAFLYSLFAIRHSMPPVAHRLEDCGPTTKGIHHDIPSLPESSISQAASPKTNWSYVEVFNPALNEMSQICVPWTMNMDAWWTHHPEWIIQSETEDMLCFAREDSSKAHFLRGLYDLQFVTGDCKNVHTKHMWSSGLAADMSNVVDGLLHGLATSRPFQITFDPNTPADPAWHYAATKSGASPVCPTKDMYCFFLPLGRCQSGEIDRVAFREETPSEKKKHMMVEYIMRPQQWLRRRVYEYMRDHAPSIDTPCAAIHVRRSDVTLHNTYSRNYFAIEDYLARLHDANVTHKTILLLTDDANAVDEALEFHPEFTWKYVNRTRHRGDEGGWENQLPSKDPLKEMVALMATFRLVKKCDTIVHGHSGFSDMLFMEMNYGGNGAKRLRVEADVGHGSIFNTNHSSSMIELEQRLEGKRNEKGRSRPVTSQKK